MDQFTAGSRPPIASSPALAVVFPGQGTEFTGMAEDYFQSFGLVRELFQMASDRLDTDLRELMAKGPPNVLAKARIAQPVVFTMSVAIASLLVERGFSPSLVAGHSMGQFTAITVAGSIDFSSALALIIERGQLMQRNNEAVNGGMMAVDVVSRDVVEAAIAENSADVWISNFNASSQSVVSGLKPALWQLKKVLDQQGALCRWLNVPGPAHSPLMSMASSGLAPRIAATTFRDPKIPLLASASAAPIYTAAAVHAELGKHMLSPVNWAKCVTTIVEHGCDIMVEAGPGRTLKGLALRNQSPLRCLTTSTVADFDTACRAVEEMTGSALQ